MRGYGQFCPIAKAAELFCERWTALVIRNLAAGAHRFNAIHRGVPHMSATLLSQRLKQLEAEGVVERRPVGQHWEYHLTAAGLDFVPLIGGLNDWGRRWTRRELEAGEMDLGLLIWGMEHGVRPTVFGSARVVVALHVSDQPDHKARYWFVNDAGGLDLCVDDPGFDTDLYLSAGLPDLIHLYRGDGALSRAIDDGRLAVDGPPDLIAKLPDWLNFAPVRTPETRGPQVV